MKRLLVAATVAGAAAGQAFAADLPPPAPPPQAPAMYIPVMPTIYNWGGVYYGVNGGYGFGKSQWTNPALGNATTGTFNLSGGLVGATVGANVQADAFVFGVEGDIDGSWLDGKSSTGLCTAVTCETRNTWLATARARVGYAADRLLFYGTGGGAIGNIQAGLNGNFDKSTKGGWAAGAGVEAAFTDNLTGRIEYLFVQLQNGACSTPGNCGIPAGDTVKFSTSMIRVGLDYKFR
jgi:outer membrane immunogenic protein